MGALERTGDGDPRALVPMDAADYEHAYSTRVAGAHRDDDSRPALRAVMSSIAASATILTVSGYAARGHRCGVFSCGRGP
jgi:hypothetical protein